MDHHYSPSEFRDKMYADLKVTPSDSVILMCSIFIASIGLNMNSIPIIIGAMLVSPLMTPILGIGFALSVSDLTLLKRAAKLLIVQVSVSLIVATLYFSISPITYASNELIARTSPTIWDVVIAFAGGTAGIIGARKKVGNNIVPGVAIATALMPPLCTVGYSIATMNVEYFLGSSYLFIINCGFIAIATYIGIRFMGIAGALHKRQRQDRRITITLAVLSILITVPSMFSAVTLVQQSLISTGISALIDEQFTDSVVIDQSYDEEKEQLTVTVTGKRLSQEEMTTIESSLPDYGLAGKDLVINQVPDLNKLTGEQAASVLNRYLEERLRQSSWFSNRSFQFDQLPFQLKD
ncbi:DUF389 domain-containing protein [Exiguobacterium sp. s193]|uniref:DUF389 domain-containing protein n=1 Tax=Exiguobacterium sp. s193 TaxID=2751207 RepID=UPI001BE7959E|nr:DUF389 domain-containing protein [Exiguobacterium sp. s193]